MDILSNIWNNTNMQKFTDIAAFVLVAKAGSYSAAARESNIPKSTLSRQVQNLEEELSVSLLLRTTRSLQLTESGKAYLQTCSRILEELTELNRATTSEQITPKGHLRITAPIEMGSYLLSPIFKEFSEKYPEISLECEYMDRFVNLYEENFDLALRAGQLQDSSLISKKLGTDKFVLVAAPDYLSKYKSPAHPKDLSQHKCLLYSAGPNHLNWALQNDKQKIKLDIKRQYIFSSLNSILKMAQSGMGIALLPEFLVAESLITGELVHVLPKWCTQANPYYLVYKPQKFMPNRLRVLLDFLNQKLTRK